MSTKGKHKQPVPTNLYPDAEALLKSIHLAAKSRLVEERIKNERFKRTRSLIRECVAWISILFSVFAHGAARGPAAGTAPPPPEPEYDASEQPASPVELGWDPNHPLGPVLLRLFHKPTAESFEQAEAELIELIQQESEALGPVDPHAVLARLRQIKDDLGMR